MILHKNFFCNALLATLLTSSYEASAKAWQYQMRGYMSARLSSYTEEKSRNYGQMARAQFEQSTKFTSSLEALNQLRWSGNSLVSDFSDKSTPDKKDVFETYLGENYLKYKSDTWVVQMGYQEVVWGEAFGFNYADIINPKDQRATLYSDASDSRLPLLLFNGKSFFSIGELSGSIQFLFSPEPRFSKTLPLELFIGDLLPQTSIDVIKEKSPKLFNTKEYGGKISASYAGTDMSVFSYSYLDRDPHYSLLSATLTNITMQEEHTKVQSYGASFARTIYDFVFRTDIVLTNDKIINEISASGQFTTAPTNTLNMLVSLDTPTYNDYSGVFIFARSNMAEIEPDTISEKYAQYFIGKLTKNLGSERSLEFSYTREIEHAGQSLQTSINWPINSTTDLKIGGEFYFGNEESKLSNLKKINSVFFSLKNYFQL